jgi:hypothetical protein
MEFDRGKITFIFLGILVMVAVGVVLKTAQSVILPLIIAWLLSFLIGPAINFMTARKIPTTLAVLIIIVVLLGIFYLSGTFLYARFAAFVEAYPRYHARFTDLIALVTSKWNLEFDPLGGINWGQSIGRVLASFSRSIFAFVSQLVLVIIFLLCRPDCPYYFFNYRPDPALSVPAIFDQLYHRHSGMAGVGIYRGGFCCDLGGAGVFFEFYSNGRLDCGLHPPDFACTGAILPVDMAGCYHPNIGNDHPAGHGKCPGAKDHGRPVEFKPGGGSAFAVILGLVVGICRGLDFHTDCGGN